MSVKRKFRKSKKTKGKTKDNNKHKNNEKRSKIQRKTKKRVLRGGKIQTGQRIVGVRNRFSIVSLSPEKCMEFFEDINRAYPDGIPPEKLKDNTQGKADFKHCAQIIEKKFPSYEIPQVSPTSTPVPEPQEPVLEESAALTSFEETDEEREKRLAAEAVAAEEKKSQKIQEANDQVAEDSEVQTDEMSDSTQTLALSDQHQQLADKYKNLEENEENFEIREIYRNAKEYHNRISTKLWLILQEQEAEQKEANTSQVEGALQPPTPNVEHQPLELDADVPVTNES